MGLAAFASMAAGVTMPLMNVVFGRCPTDNRESDWNSHHATGALTNQFVGYFNEAGSTTSQAEFESALNRNAYVPSQLWAEYHHNLPSIVCTYSPYSLPNLV